MKYGAVIIESRDLNITDIINRHKPFLPTDWEVLHIKDVPIKTTMDYNLLLTSIEFWESLPFDKVLIFQHDSALLRTGIEKFMEWDYVGAPWKFQMHGGNGGLSIRSVKAMIETLKQNSYSIFQHGNEDVFFSNKLVGKLAPRCVCSKFACETIFELGTVGYHAIEKYMTPIQVKDIKNQYK